jgi:phage terminase large subunit-like protein
VSGQAPKAGGVTIDAALRDHNLLGAALGDPSTWSNWLTVLRAAFGLPLDATQREVFHQVAGDRGPPARRVRELWAVIGRRGGKSRAAAAIAVYLALFCTHRLARGETGMVLVLAASTSQARVVFDYCLGFIEASPILRRELKDATRSELRLRSGIVIAIHSNSYRNVRGRTLLGCIFDEASFWPGWRLERHRGLSCCPAFVADH